MGGVHVHFLYALGTPIPQQSPTIFQPTLLRHNLTASGLSPPWIVNEQKLTGTGGWCLHHLRTTWVPKWYQICEDNPQKLQPRNNGVEENVQKARVKNRKETLAIM